MLTIKSNINFIFQASVIATTLVLAACSDNSASNDTDSKSTDNVNIEETISTDNNISDSSTDNSQADKMSFHSDPRSAEQKRLDTLSNYRWTLSAATGRDDQPVSALTQIKEQVTLNFNQQGNNMLSYSVGCNTMSANFQLQGDRLSTEDSMSTKMSCAELDVAENLLNQLMQGDSQLEFISNEGNNAQPLLTQVTDEVSTLIWSGQLTAQAKYNSKGETIFWAVAAESKPCQNNQLQLCLQVKPITYDELGIKASEGEYVEFAGTIDGYQHDGKHDEVLRLQRFKTNKDTVLVDNIDSKFAYVLDTVIESTVVK